MQRLDVEFFRKDERGSLTQVNTGLWKQANILDIRRDSSFGGHYHKEKEELFYVISGRVQVLVENKDSATTMDFESGECFLIEPMDKHTIYGIEDSVLVEMLSEPFSEEDTFK